MRAVAGILVVLLAACSSSGPSRSSNTNPLPSTPAAVQNSNQTCTQADLQTPDLVMPTPFVASYSMVIDTGIVARLDVPPSGNPPFDANSAWAKFTATGAFHATSAELMLGVLTANIPFGPSGPRHVHTLAWVLRLHHLAYVQPSVGNLSGGTGASTVPPACEFVNALLVLDANTGAVIVYSY